MTDQVHVLSSIAREVLDACARSTISPSQAMVETGIEQGTDAEVLSTDDVQSIQSILHDLEIVGRTTEWRSPEPIRGSSKAPSEQCVRSSNHRILDHVLSFRGTDKDLLDQIDRYLGPPSVGAAEAVTLDVWQEDNGEVVLVGDFEWRAPDRESFISNLGFVLNTYAEWSTGCVALHSGAVRSPTGEILMVLGPSGSGKSTLTGAFVAAGWDYLGDEIIGVRPRSLTIVGYPRRLSLDEASSVILGLSGYESSEVLAGDISASCVCLEGDVGALGGVLVPSRTGGDLKLERVDPLAAARLLLENSFNLARVGQAGLETICMIAERVSFHRFTYEDAREAVRLVSDESELASWASPDAGPACQAALRTLGAECSSP